MNSELRSSKIENIVFTLIACSVMGQGKIENQDSYKIYADDKKIIVAVADGLGSAPFSKEGSQKIVDITVEFLQKSDDYECLPLSIRKCWKEQVSGNPSLYDTTVKFIVITPTEIIIGGVGDGWIAINGSGYYSTEYSNVFSNQTDSILSFDLNEKFFVKRFKADDANTLLISTDGFSEDIEKDNGKAFLEEIQTQILTDPLMFRDELCSTLEKWPVETNKDDKTVVVIQRSISNE